MLTSRHAMITIFSLLMIPTAGFGETEAGQKNCDGSTVEMLECLGAQLLVADRELDMTYQAQMKTLNTDAASVDATAKSEAIEIRTRLVTAQRTWVSYREAECHLESSSTALGGPGERVFAQSCLLDMTRDRVKRLKSLL